MLRHQGGRSFSHNPTHTEVLEDVNYGCMDKQGRHIEVGTIFLHSLGTLMTYMTDP